MFGLESSRRAAEVEIRIGDDRHFVLIKAFEFLLGIDSQAHCHIQEFEHDVAITPT